MIYQTLYVDDAKLGSGFYTLLRVKEGRKLAYYLHVPSLTKIEIDLSEVARQERSGIVRNFDIPSPRLLRRMIKNRRADMDRWASERAAKRDAVDAAEATARLPNAFIDETLELLK